MVTFYRPGLAYLDTFAGLVPCRVLRTLDDNDVEIRLTAERGAYKRGEVLKRGGGNVVPRDRVRFLKYGTRIVNGWRWLDANNCSHARTKNAELRAAGTVVFTECQDCGATLKASEVK